MLVYKPPDLKTDLTLTQQSTNLMRVSRDVVANSVTLNFH